MSGQDGTNAGSWRPFRTMAMALRCAMLHLTPGQGTPGSGRGEHGSKSPTALAIAVHTGFSGHLDRRQTL